MTVGRTAAFYEAAGYTVARAAGGSWYESSAGVYRSLPDARLLDPPQEELKGLLVSRKLLALQFANRKGRGLSAHSYCARGKTYGESSLHRTFQQSVSRARTACEAHEISFEDLHRLGMAVNTDVRARRAWVDPHLVDPGLWRRFCDAGKSSSGVVVFGCFAAGELASWIAGVVEDRTCYGLHMMSRMDLRSLRPNNLLYFEFTRVLLAREDIDCVNTGLESLQPAGSIDRFKRYAGYAKEPCHFATVLHPVAASLLLSRPSHRLLELGGRFVAAESRLGRLQALVAMARASRAEGAGGR